MAMLVKIVVCIPGAGHICVFSLYPWRQPQGPSPKGEMRSLWISALLIFASEGSDIKQKPRSRGTAL